MFGCRFCELSITALQSGAPISWTWLTRPQPRPLTVAVHLWLADVDHVGPGKNEVLSPAERDRASRYRFAADRRRFERRRTFLREILSRYLELPPAAVPLAAGPTGKLHTPGLEFSPSSSGGKVLIAVAASGAVGIDIEHQRAGDWAAVVRAEFHAAEAAHLRQLSPAERARLFFDYWTLREAAGKARGTGLAEALRQLDFSPVIRAGQRHVMDSAGTRWACVSFAPAANASAALVLKS